MKILKKLLPIVSMASVAAIAAPLATSCSNGSLNFIEYHAIKTEDKPVDPYVSTFDPHEPTTETIKKEDALSIYVDKMSEDAKVFADDLMFAAFGAVYMNFEKVNYVGERHAKVTIDNYDVENATISFTYEYKQVSDKSAHKKSKLESQHSDVIKNNYNYKLQFKNFPLDIVGYEGSWFVSTTFVTEETLLDNEDWSISFAQYVDAEDCHLASSIYWDYNNPFQSMEVIIEKLNKNGWQASEDVGEYNALDAIEGFLFIQSHYLQNEGVQA